jgi:hypothetical protein
LIRAWQANPAGETDFYTDGAELIMLLPSPGKDRQGR